MKRLLMRGFAVMLIGAFCFAAIPLPSAKSVPVPATVHFTPSYAVPAGSGYTPPVINIPPPQVVVPTPFVPKLQPVPTPIAPVVDLVEMIERQGHAVDLNWPDNGELYRAPDDLRNELEMTVRIESCAAGSASYVKIYEKDTLVSGLFIGGVGEASVLLGQGLYQIKLGTGVTWLNTEDAFGRAGRYQTLLFDHDSDQIQLLAGSAYTLTINTDTVDPKAQGVGSQKESWEGF